MAYRGLGSRAKIGAPDDTENNTGNWTIHFDAQDLATNMPYYECYKICISGLIGSSMTMFVDNKQWESTPIAGDNTWDPSQPLLLNPGNELYLYWSNPATDNSPPTATIWLRFDDSIDANQRAIR